MTSNDWSLRLNNLQKLNACIERYFSSCLHIRLEKGGVNITAIAKDGDRDSLNMLVKSKKITEL